MSVLSLKIILYGCKQSEKVKSFKLVLFFEGGEGVRRKSEDVNNVYDPPTGKVSFMSCCLVVLS